MAGSKEIELQAARWLLQRDSSTWSDADEAQLGAWLAASTLHRVAYLRLEAGWEEANRLRVWGAGRERGQIPGVHEVPGDEMLPRPGQPQSDVGTGQARQPPRWWQGMGIRAAAAMLLVVVAATTGYYVLLGRGEAYSTPVGGSASIPLADGSSVTLNTASEIRVRLTSQERRVELDRGEAFFSVAKDVNRPFIVQAGSRRVVAVGTQFSVQRYGNDIRVVVTEGAVRLEGGTAAEVERTTSAEAVAGATKLAAGAVAFASDSRVVVQSQSVARAEEALSWRTGFVVFHETTLADAIAEFNRYNEREIVIADPEVAATRLTGKFRANNFDGFVRLLEESLHLRVDRVGERTVISERAARADEHR